jgi:hypothetical protein
LEISMNKIKQFLYSILEAIQSIKDYKASKLK